jgi:hypothetical protein
MGPCPEDCQAAERKVVHLNLAAANPAGSRCLVLLTLLRNTAVALDT